MSTPFALGALWRWCGVNVVASRCAGGGFGRAGWPVVGCGVGSGGGERSNRAAVANGPPAGVQQPVHRRLFRGPQLRAVPARIGNATGVRTTADADDVTGPGLSLWQTNALWALADEPACVAARRFAPGVLVPAVLATCNVAHDQVCVGALGAVLDTCGAAEAECAASPACFSCLVAVHRDRADGNASWTEALNAPECAAPGATDNEAMQTIVTQCASFPRCSYHKAVCRTDSGCSAAWDALHDGNGAAAARACSSDASLCAARVDYVINECVAKEGVSCDFWRERCARDPGCEACLEAVAELGGGERGLAAAWLSEGCALARASDGVSAGLMVSLYGGCPPDVFTDCETISSKCVTSACLGEGCATCILGAAANVTVPACEGSPALNVACETVFDHFELQHTCHTCSSDTTMINGVALATAVVGGASAFVCLACVVTIFAHGRDLVSMRDRIIIGLLAANTMFSSANAVPVNLLGFSGGACGKLALAFSTIRIGRSWWFAGKYALVGYEIFMIAASIVALTRGPDSIGWRFETFGHAVSTVAGAAAFAGFYLKCAEINRGGYNAEGYRSVEAPYNHLGAEDDLNDDGLVDADSAEFRFVRGRERYDELVRDMLIAWDAMLGVAVALWLALQLAYWHSIALWRQRADAAAEEEAADEWVLTRQSEWRERRKMIEAHREGYAEVARPLAPYVLVFGVFGVPAVVMSTSWCQSRSLAHSEIFGNVDSADVSMGTCDVWCEFVLSFRSVATAAVFLLPRERRAELADVRETWRRLRNRLIECARPSPPGYTRVGDGGDDDDDGEMAAAARELDDVMRLSDNDGALGGSWRISESDIATGAVLGTGAFGAVHRGTWHGAVDVAVKMLHQQGTDEEGDVINPAAEEEFAKECATLVCLRHPNLLKFHGYGRTASGQGFIVTELMDMGSLRDVLEREDTPLPWRTRVSIALQVALGMEHLHSKNMLHRDLKSANVLLNSSGRVAVGDFGSSRRLRPRQARLVVSTFTGWSRLVAPGDAGAGRLSTDDSIGSRSSVGGTSRDSSGSGRSGSGSVAARCRGSIVPARQLSEATRGPIGDMTKATGTLLWMAPEMFRGDEHYTTSIDVYSFGIVCWEIATRREPWHELSDGVSELEFFVALNAALQTGRRPPVPPDVGASHPTYAAVVRDCWASDPADRPSFAAVVPRLAACLRDLAEKAMVAA